MSHRRSDRSLQGLVEVGGGPRIRGCSSAPRIAFLDFGVTAWGTQQDFTFQRRNEHKKVDPKGIL